MAGRMGGEAGGGNAAGNRPWADSRHRQPRRKQPRRTVNALWIAAALLTAGFVGWPVTALVFRLARTIDDKADAVAAGGDAADDPSADVTLDPDRVKPEHIDAEHVN